MNDKEILELYRHPSSREQAVALLINTYKHRLYAHIRRMVTEHDDADDILQEVFIKAWTGLQFFREDARIFTWLYKIATNECLTFLRKKKKHRFLALDEVSHPLTGGSHEDGNALSGEEIQDRLQQAIGRLPDKQRLVFQMKYYDEMKYEDMSEILSTSVGALKANYHHAVKKIEEFITGIKPSRIPNIQPANEQPS